MVKLRHSHQAPGFGFCIFSPPGGFVPLGDWAGGLGFGEVPSWRRRGGVLKDHVVAREWGGSPLHSRRRPPGDAGLLTLPTPEAVARGGSFLRGGPTSLELLGSLH